MKKFTKIFVIFGVLFLIAGIALFTAGMTLSDWDFSKLNTALYVQREYTAAGKDITSLRVEFECADMTVETSAETDTIQISYPVRVDAEGKELSQAEFEITDGTLCVTERNDTSDFLSWNLTTPKVQVVLPMKTYGNAEFVTDTGDICADGLSARTITLQTDTGDISAKNIAAAENLTLRTDTGNIGAENAEGKSAAIGSETGDIRLRGTFRAESAQVLAETGNIDAESLDADTVLLQTSLGDISAAAAGNADDYALRIHTDLGEQNVYDAEGGPRALTARTGSGNIRITFIGA